MMRSARFPLSALATALALAPGVAHAQGEARGLATMMRECRGIAEASARTACYDKIPLDGSGGGAAAVPPPAAASPPRAGTSFGSNQLPRHATVETAEPERISVRVARAVEREPGIYLLTLEDGSEWQFVDSAPAAYDPPRPGSTVEISRASMGSYLVRYAGQRAVRARRVR